MGIFDKLKKKNNTEQNINIPQNEQLPFNIKYERTSDGRLQLDFYDKKADFKKFYDTTRLIVNETPLNLAGHSVYNCIVSWYSQNDAIVLNDQNRDMGRREDYRGVLAELDLNLLQSEPNYYSTVMKGLLDKQRVERYLDTGLEETPEIPCGKYVGGVALGENGYKKVFDVTVGEASHNSDLMVNRRREHREKQEILRQEAINNKKAQIAKMQQELEQMEK